MTSKRSCSTRSTYRVPLAVTEHFICASTENRCEVSLSNSNAVRTRRCVSRCGLRLEVRADVLEFRYRATGMVTRSTRGRSAIVKHQRQNFIRVKQLSTLRRRSILAPLSGNTIYTTATNSSTTQTPLN